ncbi:hypothetical protein DYB32_005444 [Aphanomyces invadans]|uniref:Knr4/Smi1-like domain-containing protein n=1 Tax=Aphanomyces invadans TaxID=157072 RepID=A0A418AUL5_9STRA|nr:hypothetical protein DYB32_005444 [Aphanomyces invadans]
MEKALETTIPKVPQALPLTAAKPEIIATAETSQAWDGWTRGFVPLAADADGALLVIDTKDGNAVQELSSDGIGRQLASSLTAYFETYRNELLSGNYDFVQDVGLVERSHKARK